MSHILTRNRLARLDVKTRNSLAEELPYSIFDKNVSRKEIILTKYICWLDFVILWKFEQIFPFFMHSAFCVRKTKRWHVRIKPFLTLQTSSCVRWWNWFAEMMCINLVLKNVLIKSYLQLTSNYSACVVDELVHLKNRNHLYRISRSCWNQTCYHLTLLVMWSLHQHNLCLRHMEEEQPKGPVSSWRDSSIYLEVENGLHIEHQSLWFYS